MQKMFTAAAIAVMVLMFLGIVLVEEGSISYLKLGYCALVSVVFALLAIAWK